MTPMSAAAFAALVWFVVLGVLAVLVYELYVLAVDAGVIGE